MKKLTTFHSKTMNPQIFIADMRRLSEEKNSMRWTMRTAYVDF